MTQYSSREPHRAPLRCKYCRSDTGRSWYEIPQTNPTNPILVAFRANSEAEWWELGFAAYDTFGGYDLWEHPKNRFHAFTLATPEAVDHARRVLTRLANLKEES